jgi:hypothetical protein
MSKLYACVDCGHVGLPKRAIKGSSLVELLLLICFIIPGHIYSAWRSSSRHNTCDVCGGSNIVPVDSPVGRKLVESSGKTIAQITKETETATQISWKPIAIWSCGVIVALFVIGWFM